MSTPADALLDTVRETVRARRLLSPGTRTLVAVSGGADSVCLLHVLHELSFPLAVAHLHHGTRGADSDADAGLARAHAERLGVPYCEERRDVNAEARAAGRNFHEFAREVRYAFLARTARRLNCTAVATGHHAGDQTETMLMRLLRGTGPRGLAGIPPVGEAQGVRVVRPLIHCRRADILAYLSARGLAWREDGSNRDPKYLRNRVRHELLPLLERDYNPNIQEALARLGRTLEAEDDYLSVQADAFLDACLRGALLERAAFALGHRALQRRAVLALAQRQEAECPFARVDAAVDFILEAPAGKAFRAGDLWLLNGRETTDTAPDSIPLDTPPEPVPVPGETRIFHKRFRTRLLECVPGGDPRAYCNPLRQVFDAETTGNALAVRPWAPGDRFTPLGMSGSRKLQDYFTDLRLPRRERVRQLLLVAGERILWVVGRAVDARAAVGPRTRRVLEVEVSDETE
ncbi:MAG: tRNA lysidine(34) synthetase TilS [FCB group bacterium]|nr:tRNA lysidine(34) synthetase TilS [FCB group bacterium]